MRTCTGERGRAKERKEDKKKRENKEEEEGQTRGEKARRDERRVVWACADERPDNEGRSRLG